MSLTNAYCTLQQLKNELGISDTADDSMMEIAIDAASRQIDDHCGQRFWQDGSVVARIYEPHDPYELYVDPISTTTGLIVKVDTDASGSYETTLTINTDFYLEPHNAAAEFPVRPYTEICINRNTGSYYFPTGYDAPTVQVTAKFGWPAVPDAVKKACLIQATQLFKAKDAVFGAIALGESSAMRIRSSLNPLAEALVAPYRKPAVG